MTRRRKFLKHSSHSNRRKSSMRKPRTRFRSRQNYRLKPLNSSNSTITQIATSALDYLHISPEFNVKTFQFIQRNELTRQQALIMPDDQRPMISLRSSEERDLFTSYA